MSFLCICSTPQSKSESDRLEDKVNLLIEKIDPENGKKMLAELEDNYQWNKHSFLKNGRHQH